MKRYGAKKTIAMLLLAASVWAAGYSVGDTVKPFELNDQFGKHHHLGAMPKTMVIAFEKGSAATVDEYL